MNRTVAMALAYISMNALLFALDQGPKESSAKGTGSSANATTPAAPAAIPGPMPSEQQVPVSASQMKPLEDQKSVEEARKAQIDAIQKELTSKKISAARREELKKELADLNVKTMIATPPPPTR